jgi:hypothetical protein
MGLVLILAADGTAEITQSAPERPSDLWQPLWAEHE